MFKRCCILLVALHGLAAAALAQKPASQPATQPAEEIVHLHATAVSSAEVDLLWYDVFDQTDRYVIERSTDGGATWKRVGVNHGGSDTAKYENKDVNVKQDTEYDYRIVAKSLAVLSDTVSVHTPHKNLLEAMRGETTLEVTDFTSMSFWAATLLAASKSLTAFIPELISAAIIFFIFYLVYRVTRRVVVGSMERARVDAGIHNFLMSILKWTIMGFAVVTACNQIGVQLTAIVTGVTITGLAIGFAAQDTLSNLIASVVVFMDKPIKIGDWVTVNGQYGRILKITFRSTRILSPDGDIFVFPNVFVVGNQIANHSAHPINWVNVPMTIPAKISIDQVRKALLATTAGDSRLRTDPPPKVVVDSIAGDTVSILLSFCIVEESSQSAIRQEYLEKSKAALDAIPK